MTYCHENKVILRNIKLESLLPGLRGEVRIADFVRSVHTSSTREKTESRTLN